MEEVGMSEHAGLEVFIVLCVAISGIFLYLRERR